MSKNENHELVKTMLKCGLQLLMFLSAVATIVGLFKLTTMYSANIWSVIIYVNNLFLPSKHFIQNNLHFIIPTWLGFFLWLSCVYFKTPVYHIKSFKTLTKILKTLLVIGLIILVCLADSCKGAEAALTYIFTLMYTAVSFIGVHEMSKFIADNELKLSRET